MTFEEMRKGYNDLRTAAFGRGGLSANVSPKLAGDIRAALAAYGPWYSQYSGSVWIGPVDLLPADITKQSDREASMFAGRLRALTRRAMDEGVTFSAEQRATIESVPEQLERYAANAAGALKAFGLVALLLFGLSLLRGRR